VKRNEIFATAADLQTSVTLHAFQSERSTAADHASLGPFNLDGLAPPSSRPVARHRR